MYARLAYPRPSRWFFRRCVVLKQSMRVTVRLFASHREATGVQSLSLELPEGTRADATLELLHQRYPALRSAASSVAFAVNRTVVEPNVQLHDGDELAVLPPMAGG